MSRSLFIVGEMGTGKTLMAAVAAHQHGSRKVGNYRNIIVGPPHLTRRGRKGSKWEREIKATIPGAFVFHIENTTDVLEAEELAATRDHPIWFVASRNALKMGPPFVGSIELRWRTHSVTDAWGGRSVERIQMCCCPRCGCGQVDSKNNPCDEKYFAKAKRACNVCGEQLWRSVWRNQKSGRPEFMPAEYIRNRMRFDLGIFDEAHEMKGNDTAQGQMLGMVASRCKRVLCLTGTLFGGRASDLYYLLWRMAPERMRALGFEYSSGLTPFVERYGIRQRMVEQDSERSGSMSRRRSGGTIMIEKPGVVPTLFTDCLMDRAVFLSLDELAPYVPNSILPPRPKIELITVPLGPLQEPYSRMDKAIKAAVKKSSKGGLPNMGLIAAMFSGLDTYPDHPYGWKPIYMLERSKHDGEIRKRLVCKPDNLPDGLYPKDEILLEILKAEKAAKRRCLVYTVHTIKHPVPDRLLRHIEKAGLKAVILDNVATNRREDWVEAQEKEGVDVILTHPGKVETGLDLIGWPTIIFHSMGTRPFTFRQAGARAWRLGQKKSCRIIAIGYENTMQTMIAGLMFTKARASTRLEGQVLEDLSALANTSDITDEILAHVNADTKPLIETEAVIEPQQVYIIPDELDLPPPLEFWESPPPPVMPVPHLVVPDIEQILGHKISS